MKVRGRGKRKVEGARGSRRGNGVGEREREKKRRGKGKREVEK